MVGKVTPDHMASASIISAILGQDQYKTPNDALRSCINASLGIKSKEWVQSKQAAFGDRIEGFLAESACKELQGTWLKTDYEGLLSPILGIGLQPRRELLRAH
jgi:hypothetical protein